MDHEDVRSMGAQNLYRLADQVTDELQHLPEPGQLPTDSGRVRANELAGIARAASERLRELQKAVPAPSLENFDANAAAVWLDEYTAAKAAHQREQRERTAFVAEYIRSRLPGQQPLTGPGAAEYVTRRAALTAEAEQRLGKPQHPAPKLPTMKHPQDFRTFTDAIGQLQSHGHDQQAAQQFVAFELPKLRAELGDLADDPAVFEHRLLNSDDAEAAAKFDHMHPAAGGGLLDGRDPDDRAGLPGVQNIRGELSLQRWLAWVAGHEATRGRVLPHVEAVLLEAEHRGWIELTGARGRRRIDAPAYSRPHRTVARARERPTHRGCMMVRVQLTGSECARLFALSHHGLPAFDLERRHFRTLLSGRAKPITDVQVECDGQRADLFILVDDAYTRGAA